MTSPDKVQGWPKVKVIKLNMEYKTKYFLVQIPRYKQTVLCSSESPAYNYHSNYYSQEIITMGFQ